MTGEVLTRPPCVACDILELPRENRINEKGPDALLCRLFGHKMVREARAVDSASRLGQFEVIVTCKRGCRMIWFWVKPEKELGEKFCKLLYPEGVPLNNPPTYPPYFTPYVPIRHTHNRGS